jgi:hypothetical protein
MSFGTGVTPAQSRERYTAATKAPCGRDWVSVDATAHVMNSCQKLGTSLPSLELERNKIRSNTEIRC